MENVGGIEQVNQGAKVSGVSHSAARVPFFFK
jgi:hypothetical protein